MNMKGDLKIESRSADLVNMDVILDASSHNPKPRYYIQEKCQAKESSQPIKNGASQVNKMKSSNAKSHLNQSELNQEIQCYKSS